MNSYVQFYENPTQTVAVDTSLQAAGQTYDTVFTSGVPFYFVQNT